MLSFRRKEGKQEGREAGRKGRETRERDTEMLWRVECL